MSNSRERVKIFVKNGEKSIRLECERSNTISSLKAKIQEEEGIPADQQELLNSNAMKLDDGSTVANSNIYQGSTLTLEPKLGVQMNIYINTFTGNTIPLQVNSSNTINEVKAMIHDIEGVPPHQQILIFNGYEVNSSFWHNYHDTLADFSIPWNATLYLVLKGNMQNFLNAFNEKTIPLNVQSSSTISNVKAEIQDKEGDPSHQQELILKGMHLDNNRTMLASIMSLYAGKGRRCSTRKVYITLMSVLVNL
ncbi:polyubiquitin 11 [Tanacetum coccineum]